MRNRLTESDLTRIVRRVIKEEEDNNSIVNDLIRSLKDDLDKMAMKNNITVEDVCNQLIDICEEIKEYAKKSGPSDFENINAFGL